MWGNTVERRWRDVRELGRVEEYCRAILGKHLYELFVQRFAGFGAQLSACARECAICFCVGIERQVETWIIALR